MVIQLENQVLQSDMVYASKYDCHAFLISVIYPILKCITIKQAVNINFFILACVQIENERLT